MVWVDRPSWSGSAHTRTLESIKTYLALCRIIYIPYDDSPKGQQGLVDLSIKLDLSGVMVLVSLQPGGVWRAVVWGPGFATTHVRGCCMQVRRQLAGNVNLPSTSSPLSRGPD